MISSLKDWFWLLVDEIWRRELLLYWGEDWLDVPFGWN